MKNATQLSSSFLTTTEKKYLEEFSLQFIYSSPEPVIIWQVPDEFSIDLSVNEKIQLLHQIKCIEINDAALQTFKVEARDAIVGLTYDQMVRKSDIDKAFPQFIENEYKLFDLHIERELFKSGTYNSVEHWYGILENSKLVRIFTAYKDVTPLITAGKELDRKADRYKQLVENMNDLVYHYQLYPEQKFVYVSPSSTYLTGYTPQEHYDDPYLGQKLILPEDRPILEKVMNDANEKSRVTLRWKTKNNRVIWTEQAIVRIYDENKRLVALEGIARDVTDKVLADKELRLAEEKFRTLFEYAPDAFYLNDLKGRFIDGNKAAENLIGYNKHDLIGKSFLDYSILPKRLIPKATMMLAKNALGQKTGPTTFTLNHKDGNEVQIESSTFPVKLGDKKVILGIARNITDRRKMEKALIRNEEILNEAQSIARIGSWEMDLKTKEVTWSLETYRILEAKPHKVKANFNYYYALVHPDDRTHVGRVFSQSIHDKQSFHVMHRLLLSDGNVKYVEIRGRIYVNEDGEPIQSIGIIHDVTKMQNVENALQQTEEKFIKLFEYSPNTVVVSSVENGKITDINKVGLKLLGLEKSKVLNKTSIELGLIDQQARARIFQGLEASGEFSDLELEITVPSGKKYIVLSYGQIVLLDNKPYLFQTFVDITERKRAESIILKSRDSLEALVKERTTEIEAQKMELLKKTQKLEGFNKVLLQRENRIIEIKEEVNELCKELGREIIYPPVWGHTRNNKINS